MEKNTERIAAGIEYLHGMIDDNLEGYLEGYGDASYCGEITEATNSAFADRPWINGERYTQWQQVNWGIEGEWDRLCRLYFVDGLRGEALVAEARKR